MQRGIGAFALFAILVAGARFAASPPLAKTSESPAAAAAAHIPAHAQPKETSCSEFLEHTEKNPSTPGEIAAMIDRYRDVPSGNTPTQWKLPAKVILLTIPDPLHTHLNLFFDRTMEALQEAAQDEQYDYDSSWLPWKTQIPEFSGRQDQQKEEDATRQRELCPGVILFRQSRQLGSNEDTYAAGLLVFVIGEQPTTGINRTQWDNALGWIEDHVEIRGDNATLRILGPTFSGSVPSAVRALKDLQEQQQKQKTPFTSVLLYTGTMRGCVSYTSLEEELKPLNALRVRTRDFDQNDLIQIDRYFEFLRERGHEPSEVAILSEDQTAYGGLPVAAQSGSGAGQATGNGANQTAADKPPCQPDYQAEGPLYLYYPRDISALRSAYQEQSIFAPAGTAASTHIVLQPQASESTHIDTDTIPSFGGANSALNQEAQLYGVVDSLKAHGIRFVILRGTSTLDYLFLTRFFHRAYPEAFIVTMGPDILFGREIDSTEFRGVTALTTYPLLPRGQDWTSGSAGRHAHRIFGSDSMEGTYLAARFVITDGAPAGRPDADANNEPDLLFRQAVPDYGPPFWDSDKQDTGQPVIWLSVVGRDGYWPVAVLNARYSPNGLPEQKIRSNLSLMGASNSPPAPPLYQKFSLSPAWKLCCALMLLCICAHLLACRLLWNCQSLSMFVQFKPLHGARQLVLMGFGWGVICGAVIFMYGCSAPLGHDLQGRNDWWISILAVSMGLGLLGIVWDMGVRSMREMRSLPSGLPGLIFWMPLLLFVIVFVASRAIFSDMPTAYRAVHLTSGVSPVSSLLLMMCGFYWWFWQELSGVALLDQGRPVLPCEKNVPKVLVRVSSQMAGQIEAFAIPLPYPSRKAVRVIFYVFPLIILGLLYLALMHPSNGNFDSMLHSFENESFNRTLHLLFAIALYLLILECCQLLSTWLSLKRLLLALNRTPLRRTFSALQGLSMHSLWGLSGTTSRSRYTIFSHQLESLFHLRNVLESSDARCVGNQRLRVQLKEACKDGQKFIENRGRSADLAMDNSSMAWRIRQRMSQCTECILENLLLPEWCEETGSLDLLEGEKKDVDKEVLPLSEKKPIRRAEEFICLIYVGYLQNLLARMRTMVLAILGLYAALAFSLAFYPYTPRPAIALSLLLLLLAVGSVVALVYAGLDRDTTLSHITDTKPGTLGFDFWVRLGSFIGVPIVGLLVAQFPEIADFIASWIQPSLNAVK